MANRRTAVIIGVDATGVGSSLPSLRFAQRDATAMATLLCDPQLGTFDPADVTLFLGAEASVAAIKATLRRIVLGSESSDVLVVYFAGHALVPSWSDGTDLYLVTPGLAERALSDDPEAGLRMAFIIRDVLQHFMGASLLILDCCQAGRPTTGRSVTFGGAALIGGPGDPRHGVLAACATDEYAREDRDAEHGIFTHRVLGGLLGAAADARGEVTFETLSGYVRGQVFDPPPTTVLRARGKALLTTPGLAAHRVAAHRVPAQQGPPSAAGPDEIQVVDLENPLDQHVPGLTRHIGRLARGARTRSTTEHSKIGMSRVEYVRSALDAAAVAYLSRTGTAGFVAINATDGFDLDVVRDHLQAAEGGSGPAPSTRGFGRIANGTERRLWSVPLGTAGDQGPLLVVVNPPAWLVGLGQPGAKVLQTIWHTDFADDPRESEVQVLTALRATFGRLPDQLFERCLRLYREVLSSIRIVFQPVVTIGESAGQVGVHSYEALARHSLADQSAPFALLQLAHTWGNHFVVERDKIILGKALTSYTLAHANSAWNGDVPKPVSVNVSVRSLLDDTYVETLRQLIDELQLHPNAVTLEISEQDAIEPWAGEQWGEAPLTYFNRRLAAIVGDVGVAFALDDFGTGQASLSRMAELPLTHIKIDRAILHHRQAIQELKLVVAVSRDAIDRGETHTPRPVIVEGVDHESPVSLRQIYRAGIRHIQGYITGERGTPDLRLLTAEIRKDIAARVRGDDENRPTELGRADRDAPLRRSA